MKRSGEFSFYDATSLIYSKSAGQNEQFVRINTLESPFISHSRQWYASGKMPYITLNILACRRTCGEGRHSELSLGTRSRRERSYTTSSISFTCQAMSEVSKI